MSNIDDILYFNTSKWNIEGRLSIDDVIYNNVYGEAIVSNAVDTFGESMNVINVSRTFSATTDDGLIYLQFDDTILKSSSDDNICRYTLNTPVASDPLTGLYVLSFGFVHAMYAQKQGGFSAQESFIKNDDDTYINNGFMFKNAKLHLRWDLRYSQDVDLV